jgi:hypothetical protein
MKIIAPVKVKSQRQSACPNKVGRVLASRRTTLCKRGGAAPHACAAARPPSVREGSEDVNRRPNHSPPHACAGGAGWGRNYPNNSRIEPLNRCGRSCCKRSDDDSPSPGGEGRGEVELTNSRVREALINRFMRRESQSSHPLSCHVFEIRTLPDNRAFIYAGISVTNRACRI